jgi:hypothetical protein
MAKGVAYFGTQLHVKLVVHNHPHQHFDHEAIRPHALVLRVLHFRY